MFKIRDKETGEILGEDDLIDGYLVRDIYVGFYGDLFILIEDEGWHGGLETSVYEVDERYEAVAT